MKNNNQVVNSLFKNLLKITLLNSYKESFNIELQQTIPGFFVRIIIQVIDSIIVFLLRMSIAVILYPIHKIFLNKFNQYFTVEFGDAVMNFSNPEHFNFYLNSFFSKWIFLYLFIIFATGMIYNSVLIKLKNYTIGMKIAKCKMINIDKEKISMINVVIYSVLFYTPLFAMIIAIWSFFFIKSMIIAITSVIFLLIWYEGGFLVGRDFKIINKISKLVLVKNEKNK